MTYVYFFILLFSAYFRQSLLVHLLCSTTDDSYRFIIYLRPLSVSARCRLVFCCVDIL